MPNRLCNIYTEMYKYLAILSVDKNSVLVWFCKKASISRHIFRFRLHENFAI